PRVPVAPEDVLVAPAEEARGEERGLARREALDPVAGRGACEALGAHAPADEAPRHDADAMPGGEEAEDEVVVLGPARVAVAERVQASAAHQQGRMRDGALDEGLGPHALRAVDAVQPLLVLA